jgi:hypothetical protein
VRIHIPIGAEAAQTIARVFDEALP